MFRSARWMDGENAPRGASDVWREPAVNHKKKPSTNSVTSLVVNAERTVFDVTAGLVPVLRRVRL